MLEFKVEVIGRVTHKEYADRVLDKILRALDKQKAEVRFTCHGSETRDMTRQEPQSAYPTPLPYSNEEPGDTNDPRCPEPKPTDPQYIGGLSENCYSTREAAEAVTSSDGK